MPSSPHCTSAGVADCVITFASVFDLIPVRFFRGGSVAGGIFVVVIKVNIDSLV